MDNRVQVRLTSLRDDYVEAVNTAVAEGRFDLVERLSSDYPDAAMRVLTAEPARR